VIGVLDAALGYAQRGWLVFPCRAGGKAPLTVHGYLDATTDPEVIRRWWAKWPRANVGIATGNPGPDVLDVDQREDGSGFAALNRLNRAGLTAGAHRIVRTPSGGLHAYFTGTAQRGGSLPKLHLDFKAQGGYVIAPPSALAGGRRWELAQVRDGSGVLDWQACKALLVPAPAPQMSARSTTLAGLASWVERQPHGNRNAGLYWAACRALDEGLDPWPLTDAAMAAGLDQAETARTVTSALRRAGRG
jgi:Bifunctional DNA primase/polymerase, N-terminal